MLANKQANVSQLAVTTLHVSGIGCLPTLADKVIYKCKLAISPARQKSLVRMLYGPYNAELKLF